MRCQTPITIPNIYFGQTRDKEGNLLPSWTNTKDPFLQIPCGKCVFCRERAQLAWTQRLQEEMNNSCYSAFITLTIAPEYMQYITLDDEYQFFDSQYWFKFIRDFRSQFEKYHYIPNGFKYEIDPKTNKSKKVKKYKKIYDFRPDFRYYACTEFGGDRHRLHMHVLICFKNIFNDNCADYYKLNKLLDIILKLWTYGNVHAYTADKNASFYVTKYLLKLEDDFSSQIYNRLKSLGVEERSIYLGLTNRHFISKGIGSDYMVNALHSILDYDSPLVYRNSEYDPSNRVCNLADYYKRKFPLARNERNNNVKFEETFLSPRELQATIDSYKRRNKSINKL